MVYARPVPLEGSYRARAIRGVSMVSERPKVCLGVISARFRCTRLHFLVLIELNEISPAVGGYPCLEAGLAVV